jgi:uncharacterized protein (DUF2237 family)
MCAAFQQEDYGNRVIASDLANPDFVKFGESFGAAAERVRSPEELRGATPARLCAARWSDPDRDAGRPDAEPVGLHLPARR